jgi:hypothetical protein
VISKYQEGLKEISSMDEKMHLILLKMKKENVVSEIIFKRIE